MRDQGKFKSEHLTRRLRQLALGLWLVLVATGIYLIFGYRPTASAAYSDMESLRSGVTVELWVRRVHNFASVPALLVLLALAVIHFDRDRLPQAEAAVAGLVVTAGLWYSGRLLPWDQIALWSVTAGTNLTGFRSLFDDDNVRFVLVNGNEVSLNNIRFWFVVHAAALPIALMLIAVCYVVLGRRATNRATGS